MATSDEGQIVNAAGKQVGTVALDPTLFAAPVNQGIVHGVVRWQRAKRRAGTHATLTRSMIKGGGKKPWAQKGTGNARQGSTVSPLWVGGAIALGPQPRDYEYRLNKRERRVAMASVLTDKRASGALVILEGLSVPSGKTRDAVTLLAGLGLKGKKVLVIASDLDEATTRSLQNIRHVRLMSVDGVNVYDLMAAQAVVCTATSVAGLQTRWQKKEKN